MPGRLNGLELADLVQAHWPHIGVILSSGVSRLESRNTEYGPLFIPKPWHSQDIGGICRRALRIARRG
jgi:hypothetical protein